MIESQSFKINFGNVPIYIAVVGKDYYASMSKDEPYMPLAELGVNVLASDDTWRLSLLVVAFIECIEARADKVKQSSVKNKEQGND